MMRNRIKVIIVLSFLCVSLLYCSLHNAYCTSLDEEEVSGFYTEAVTMFRKANELATTNPAKAKTLYQSSVMRFERIIKDGGIENGKLYYNIGNAYFRMNDLGMAILNYRKAKMLTPDDANLQHNLQYARSRRIDRIEEEQKTKVLKTLFFWHYDISTGIRFIVLSIMSACLWITASVRFFYKKRLLNRLIFFPAILVVLMLGSLIVEKVSIESLQPGVIIAPEVTARKGNSEAYEPAFKEPLHAGTEFILIEERKDWFYVELPDSRRCWVSKAGAFLVRKS